jgi:hypothetical protein
MSKVLLAFVSFFLKPLRALLVLAIGYWLLKHLHAPWEIWACFVVLFPVWLVIVTVDHIVDADGNGK